MISNNFTITFQCLPINFRVYKFLSHSIKFLLGKIRFDKLKHGVYNQNMSILKEKTYHNYIYVPYTTLRWMNFFVACRNVHTYYYVCQRLIISSYISRFRTPFVVRLYKYKYSLSTMGVRFNKYKIRVYVYVFFSIVFFQYFIENQLYFFICVQCPESI